MIVHGTVDHSGVYAGLANELTKKGIAVIAMDMRGWGLSDGESMYLNDMDTFVEDVNTLYRKIHALPRFEKVKSRFLLGKSLGGLITAFAVAAYPTNWTGLLGLSGAYQLDPGVQPSPLLVCIMRGIGMVVPKLAFKEPFDEHLIASDKKALEAWRQDDLCCKDKLRLGYGINILQGTQELVSTRVVDQLNIPMLMMIGDADRVVTKAGHELMVNRSQHYDTKLQVYPHGYHNLLQEPALQGQLMMDICNWILNRSF
jgi:acylglycerol lipase